MKSTMIKPSPIQKTILGLVGSPRKLGNCEIFIKEITRHVPFPHSLRLIRMPSLDIRPCKACYQCIMGEDCPHNDDMDMLFTEIAAADALLIASPVYFLGTHSIFKRVLDRCFLVYSYIEKTYKTPCILINTYGVKERIGTAPQALLTFASYLTLDIRANLNIMAAMPGDIIKTKKNRDLARELGGLLFSDTNHSFQRDTGCPFCGCDIVRMTEGKFICTLCHGSFSFMPDGTVQKIKEGGIFGPPSHMYRHKRWLQGMKERFLKHKKESLRTLIPYKNIGGWIRE